MKRIIPLLAAAVLAPQDAGSHPHIFVDTALKVIVSDSGQLEAVEITWAYDEFYSLLIFEDRGLDGDYDGALTAQELAKLQGFDMAWVEGFQGDTYLTRAGVVLELGAPEHLATEVADGRITTRHRRVLAEPQAADGLVIKAYDPGYYTAYTMTGGLEVSGGCQASVTPPDLDAAYTKVEELLYAMPADQAEEAYPEVGEAFADTVRLRCGT
ncbi:DUF1007 family protein [Leisingera aquaemixtae]|uniref:ABC-type uncharacterized transport system, periplasmic component n=1 Tax=Leisingera aquaemixtae TaxID=1396826 RepID=A0A0P1HWT1_9RHOB|nr:DUF1007 family protein [Leisingera aquaemixtae]CUH99609.1 ABC-type uncharacterized transport system, periplasmic component [Leisingera aquaemixtae]